jgi:DNA sulfur modification protein DndC
MKPDFFGGVFIDDIYKEIQKLYRSNSYPWIVGYSGGKDSTTTVQLVWRALSQLPKNELFKPVYIISSDTLVEIPKVVNFIDKNIIRMNNSAEVKKLPFQAVMVKPDINKSFWVNLIGRGYPAPTSDFRWCTDRLKIHPINKFISETASKHGEVVVVLGLRRQESISRQQSIDSHKIEGNRFARNSSIPQAYVYTPIENWSVDEVWSFLSNYSAPWGTDHKELISMYRRANDGECPLVVDTSSPSCGNSRFGCWCCTVVKVEKSLNSLIRNGEVWLHPLQEFRELLMVTQNPEEKHKYRSHIRRDGKTYEIDSSRNKENKEPGEIKLGRGPYYFWFRKELLKKLLEAEKEAKKLGKVKAENVQLITHEELIAIRDIWHKEDGDWKDSVSQIYYDVYGSKLDVPTEGAGIFDSNDLDDLTSICTDMDLNLNLMLNLLNSAQYYSHFTSKKRLIDTIEEEFKKEWREEDEIMEHKVK